MSVPYRDPADRPVGTVVAVHPWGTGPGWLIGILFVCFFGYLVHVALNQETWTGMDTVGFVVMGAVMLGLAGLMFWLSARTRGDHATVHEDAIVQRTRGMTKTLHFDRVRSMRSRIERRGATAVHRHVIEGEDGEKVLLSQIYADIDGLVAEIHARLGPIVVARTLAALDEGKAVDFDRFEMHGDRIVLRGGDSMPMRDLRADVDGGVFSLRKSGERKAFASFAYDAIPNGFVVEAVLERMRAGA